MTLSIELEQEVDGRWIAEVGAMLRVLAERLEHGEAVPEFLNVTFLAA